MSEKVGIVKGDLSFAVKNGKNLKLENTDSHDYNVEIHPTGFSKENQSFTLKAGKTRNIKANGAVPSGQFFISITPLTPSKAKSKNQKDDQSQIPPRMIIKVE